MPPTQDEIDRWFLAQAVGSRNAVPSWQRPVEKHELPLRDDPPMPSCSWHERLGWYLAIGLFTIGIWGYALYRLLS